MKKICDDVAPVVELNWSDSEVVAPVGDSKHHAWHMQLDEHCGHS